MSRQTNEAAVAEAKNAISKIFSDTSVSRAVTKKYLEEIQEHLDGYLDDLRSEDAED